ncbi:hypothetical protein PVAND_001746 [Polypedilum vanderplanki]|uniref:Uncharacterized protein n=1 Tax=Polypedilum vanderplanki TaxID=319348 RepID=A0A9J6BNV0_POLVA|nr:hypothetical protein PVAND_001746 [Polypedilum vanderplanki]
MSVFVSENLFLWIPLIIYIAFILIFALIFCILIYTIINIITELLQERSATNNSSMNSTQQRIDILEDCKNQNDSPPSYEECVLGIEIKN